LDAASKVIVLSSKGFVNVINIQALPTLHSQNILSFSRAVDYGDDKVNFNRSHSKTTMSRFNWEAFQIDADQIYYDA
jgi:hypothetical protein